MIASGIDQISATCFLAENNKKKPTALNFSSLDLYAFAFENQITTLIFRLCILSVVNPKKYPNFAAH